MTCSLVVLECPVASFLHEVVPASQLEIIPHHLLDELRKADPGRPAELCSGLRGIAEQGINLRRPKIAWIHGDDTSALCESAAIWRLLHETDLVHALTFPLQ